MRRIFSSLLSSSTTEGSDNSSAGFGGKCTTLCTIHIRAGNPVSFLAGLFGLPNAESNAEGMSGWSGKVRGGGRKTDCGDVKFPLTLLPTSERIVPSLRYLTRRSLQWFEYRATLFCPTLR